MTTTAPPRTVGTRRPASRIQPGWWVHLLATDDAPEGTPPGEWEVAWIADTNRGNRALVFKNRTDDEGNTIRCHKTDEVVTLTAREAKRHGLGEGS